MSDADAPAIAPGDRVLALEPSTARRWLLRLDGGHARKVPGLGVLDPNRFAGEAWGSKTEAAGKHLVLLRPTVADLHRTVRRKAQIIGSKDASRIVFELGVGAGDKVLESGIGSGATTMVLAHAAGAEGRVVVQELRQDFVDWAMENVDNAGLGDRVEAHVGDLTEGLVPAIADAGPYDAVLLDQPEPWKALPNVVPVLTPGARVACFSPQVSQMERCVRALEDAGFCDVRAIELIERGWEVKELGSRPSFDGLGHTAFLVFGRWAQ